MSRAPQIDTSDPAEVEALRVRIAELETELIETADWANRTVGQAQERLYWLDRWHLDLNALMLRPSANRIRAALRAFRGVYRVGLSIRRRLRPDG